jgi:Cytochrome c554 and c-prime
MKPKWVVRLALAAIVAGMLMPAAAVALPSNVPSSSFPEPASCGCHAQQLSIWQTSMHAKALDDKAYQTKLRQAQDATNGKLGEFCNTCHGPVATMTGAMKVGSISPANNGITCMFCHQVTGTTKPVANVSQTVKPDGTRRAQIRDPQAPHPAAYSEFHQTSEFCGACHNVRHPVNGMHLEATYQEWLKSPYAKAGVQCQDCHMSKTVGAVGPYSGEACAGGPGRSNIYQMSFVGANVGQGPPVASRAQLQRAATIKLEAPEILSEGSKVVTVTITNKNAGHYLPTGLTEVRQMWLEVTAEGPDGSKVVGTRKFGTELADKNGKFPVELWDATSIHSDDRIPPRQSTTSTFTVELPDGSESAKLTAALYYRSLPEELAKEAGVENPTTVMTSAESMVYATPEAMKTAAASLVPPHEDPGSGGLTWIMAAGIAAVIGVLVYAVVAARRNRRSAA